MSDDRKTPEQVVAAANDLARQFYRSHGYQVPKGYRFDQAHHPQERSMWSLAVLAYAHVDGTDVEDALTLMEEAA